MTSPTAAKTRPAPEPAESFAADFSAARMQEVIAAMRQLGGFRFISSTPSSSTPGQLTTEGVDRLKFTGEREDGCRITITVERGAGYRSPAELQHETDLDLDKSGFGPGGR